MSATMSFPLRPVGLTTSSRAERSSSSCRLEITISAPAWARPPAIALPNPLLPPVTRATLPARSKMRLIMLLLRLSLEIGIHLVLREFSQPGKAGPARTTKSPLDLDRFGHYIGLPFFQIH